MPTKKTPKTVVVKEHPRRVPVSKKNPSGITIVDKHLRHIEGQYLDKKMIADTFINYDKKKVILPAKGKLLLPNEDEYDEYIAMWVHYFNKKLNLKTEIDPDMIKALIASESTFKPAATNKTATGLTQITTATLKILQDLSGESKEFVFKDIRKKDLTDPNVAIALGVRWIAYKKQYADKILKRAATSDEVIQVYKGILSDDSKKASEIMKSYRGFYEKLKK
jgi:Soluble lytic murein transglycosylase and related regulatory proteins (some contain LysM/invasin domains)